MDMTEAMKAKYEEINANVAKIINEMQPRIKALEEKGEGTAELKQEVQNMVQENAKLHDEIKAMTDRIDGVETSVKSAPRFGEGPTIEGAISDAMKSMSSESRETVNFEVDASNFVKTITNLTASAGPLLINDYRPGILAPGMRQLTIADLIMSGTTTSAAMTYMQEKEQTGGPDYQLTQGAEKATTSLTFEEVTKVVATIAHTSKASTQMLDDVPALQSYITQRMGGLLAQKLEDEILNGTGVGARLHGIKAQADAFDTAHFTALDGGGNPLLTQLGAAVYQAQLSHSRVDGIVIAPREAWKIRLATRDSGGDGGFLVANIALEGPNLRVLGLPTVETQAQPAGHFTVGPWGSEAQLFMRQQANVRVSTENEDDFNRNLVSIRNELRAVLAVYRPSAFVTGTFPA